MKTKIKLCTICKQDRVHFVKDGTEMCAVCRKKTITNPFGDFFDKTPKK